MSRRCSKGPPPVPGPPAPAEVALLDALIASLPDPTQPLTQVHYAGSFVAARCPQGAALSSTLGMLPSPEDDAQALVGQPIGDVAHLLHGPSGYLRAVALAALNAGLPVPPQATGGNVADLLLDCGAGRRVVIVGDFPFWPRVAEVTESLDLIELKDTPDRLPPERWDEALARADVLALTSTTLLTASLSRYVLAAPRARTIVLGPSTPWSPALFELGVDVLGGSVLRDEDAVIEGVRQGEHFHALKRRGAAPLLWRRQTDPAPR